MQLNRMKFTGNAREYFGIWIVNLLLSIVTLGIYTAWAKVRRLRYFYGHTHLDGHNFEYHAKPKSILIGRIIVVGVLVALNILVSFSPLFLLLFIPYFLALPWIINLALRFNARVTSYRNVRFVFAGNYWRSLWVFLGIPLLGIVSAIASIMLLIYLLVGYLNQIQFNYLGLGVLFIFAVIFIPWMSTSAANYIGNNLSYGDAKVTTLVEYRRAVLNFLVTIPFYLVVSFVLGLLAAIIGSVLDSMGIIDLENLNQMIRFQISGLGARSGLVAIAGYAAFFVATVFYRAGIRNLAYDASRLDGKHDLHSDIRQIEYSWIVLVNLFATIFTIGLLRPWAAIRSWRYQAEHTALYTEGDLSEIVDEASVEGAATSAEFLDIEGIDFGL